LYYNIIMIYIYIYIYKREGEKNYLKSKF
jgi:hypothetical protein